MESCRQLGDALLHAWHVHGNMPYIPPDEDEVLQARRVVAQRCLYGVDKNPMAVDLTKLSLWLATLAKDHPFTFLDPTQGETLSYVPARSLDTYPFPPGWETNLALEAVGKQYYEFRAALMVRNNEGLTKTYNRFHDPNETGPDILRLRELHDAMDRAVLDAYGWTDIRPTCEFLLNFEDEEGEETSSKRKKPWRYRWPDEIRDEVLARLLALNAERAEEERLAGEAAAKETKKAPRKPRGKGAASSGNGSLFE